MADTELDLARGQELVHARYLGTSPVVMPGLAGRDRCCKDENQRAAEPEGGETLKPHSLVEHGDVVLLDRYSAEGRDDFEIVEPHIEEPASKARPRKSESDVKEG